MAADQRIFRMTSELQDEKVTRAQYPPPRNPRYEEKPKRRVEPPVQKMVDATSALSLSEELVKVIRSDEERSKEENKRVKQLEKDVEALQNEKDALQKENQKMESKCQQTDKLLETIKTLRSENSKYKEGIRKDPGEGNPNIPDLSDPYRAVRVAEKYTELYDNEWTNACEILCNDGSDEEQSTKKLLDILKNCYELCADLSEKQMTVLEMVLLNPGASIIPMNRNYPKQDAGEGDNLVISKSTQWHLNFCRKDMLSKIVDTIFKDHARSKLGLIADTVPHFVKGCIKVCWLMCTLQPPVVIGREADVGSAFDYNVYRTYSISGAIVSYNVWPPLLLHKDGPLLVKGVAQSIKVSRLKKSTAGPKTYDVGGRVPNHF